MDNIKYILILFFFLAGCDSGKTNTIVKDNPETLANQIVNFAKFKAPMVVLAPEIKVNIDQFTQAILIGPDECEFMDFVKTGCTILTGKKSVDVILYPINKSARESFKETWKVYVDDNKYTLQRPNGFLITLSATK